MSENKQLNEIIRIKKRPSNFVMMDKTFLEDNRLSFKAKGILAYLLSKPDNWKVIVQDIMKYSTDGKASVYTGLKELKEYGYYEKIPVRNEQGTQIIRWESTIYEVPQHMFHENENAGEKQMQNQLSENREEEQQSGFVLLTDFQEEEKREKKSLLTENQDVENQFIENRDRINNNKLNNIYNQSVSPSVKSVRTDIMETDIQDIIQQIRKNIGYDDLKAAHADDVRLIDEFVSIILDTLLTREKDVRINGENKPRELVRHMLMKLTFSDIEHVLWQFKEHGERINKKPQYILTMLYHSPMELKAHYENLVRSDREKGSWQTEANH